MSSRIIEILLVEDNPGDARLTLEAFKEGKVLNHITVARDGVEALAYLRRQDPGSDSARLELAQEERARGAVGNQRGRAAEEHTRGGFDHLGGQRGHRARLQSPCELLRHQACGLGAIPSRRALD